MEHLPVIPHGSPLRHAPSYQSPTRRAVQLGRPVPDETPAIDSIRLSSPPQSPFHSPKPSRKRGVDEILTPSKLMGFLSPGSHTAAKRRHITVGLLEERLLEKAQDIYAARVESRARVARDSDAFSTEAEIEAFKRRECGPIIPEVRKLLRDKVNDQNAPETVAHDVAATVDGWRTYDLPPRLLQRLMNPEGRNLVRSGSGYSGALPETVRHAPSPDLSAATSDDRDTLGGTPHAVDQHAGKTMDEILTRLRSEATLFQPATVSTFYDTATAQFAVDIAFISNQNQLRIHNFMQDAGARRLTLHSGSFTESLGYGVHREDDGSLVEKHHLDAARLVIEKDPGYKTGFKLLTALPIESEMITPEAQAKYLYPLNLRPGELSKAVHLPTSREIVAKFRVETLHDAQM